jgi:uncharacterized protein YcnI
MSSISKSTSDRHRGHTVRKARTIAVATAGVGLVAGSILATAGPASAHATVQLYGSTASTGGYGAMFIRIPHGCSGAATRKLAVRLPASFGSARPQWIPGWTANVVTLDDGSRRVTWTKKRGGLPDGQFADFGISVKWPEAQGMVYVPVVQHCRTSSVRWTQIPQAGQPEPEYPAPSVMVHRGSSPHGH